MTTIESARTQAKPRTRPTPDTSRPRLCFVYSPTSGPSRRAEGFLAQVLQRRQNHRAFVLQRINCVERPDLAEKLGANTVPSLVVVEGRRVRARLEGLSGCKEIEQLLEPWLAPVEHGADEELDRVVDLPLPAAAGESLNRVTIDLPSDLGFDRWRLIGRRISSLADASTWWLADWAAFGEARYGEKYEQAVEITGISDQTLRNYAWVARRFDVSRRRDRVSFAHHSEVAALSEPDQDAWLDRAEELHWSRNELRAALKEARAPDDPASCEHVRLDVAPERVDRWRSAARTGGLKLPDWIIRVADHASG